MLMNYQKRFLESFYRINLFYVTDIFFLKKIILNVPSYQMTIRPHPIKRPRVPLCNSLTRPSTLSLKLLITLNCLPIMTQLLVPLFSIVARFHTPPSSHWFLCKHTDSTYTLVIIWQTEKWQGFNDRDIKSDKILSNILRRLQLMAT